MLGHPVAHSLSPALHRAAYAALGLDWTYGRHDVDSPELAAFVAGLDESWAGLSLTMPLKQAAIPLLDHVEPLADLVGAVNTVLVQPGGGGGSRGGTAGGRAAAGDGSCPALVGANTDVHGIVAALREATAGGSASSGLPRGVILGAGATAASAVAALAELGCTRPTVLARSLGRTGAVRRAAHRMGVDLQVEPLDDGEHTLPLLEQADLVVSTMPAGAADALATALAGTWTTRSPGALTPDARAEASTAARPSAPIRGRGALLDVVYDPRPTALLRAWRESGRPGVGGERMLLHQAVEQVRLMTGRPAPVAAMDHALQEALTDSPASR